MLSISIISETQAYLLASSNLTPWHLLKSHPVSPANSSRVTYPLGCFMTGIFYETTVGLPALRGQTARQQRSEWMAHFLAVAWWRGYSCSRLSSRLSVTRHTDRVNLEECDKPLSASSALCTEHHMGHYELFECDKSPQKTVTVHSKGSVPAWLEKVASI